MNESGPTQTNSAVISIIFIMNRSWIFALRAFWAFIMLMTLSRLVV